MTLSISKEFTFSASHVIHGLPPGHKCGRLHGHSYRVRVEVVGETDSVGFIIDYGALEPIRELISMRLDHRHLNDALDVNPTAENIAKWLTERIAEWISIRPEVSRIHSVAAAVSETAATWATSTRKLAQ